MSGWVSSAARSGTGSTKSGLVNVDRRLHRRDPAAPIIAAQVDSQTQDDREAEISVFVAVGHARVSGAREAVQEHYAELAVGSHRMLRFLGSARISAAVEAAT